MKGRDSAVRAGFTNVKLKTRMMIGYYSGIVVYVNLYGGADFYCEYFDGLISLDVKELQTYATHICNDVKDSDGGVIIFG